MKDRLAAVEGELQRLRDAFAVSEKSQVGLVEILMRDIARREDTTRQLESAQSWIQLAQETGGVAAYSMAAPRGPLTWSASTFKLYGIDPAETPGLEVWLHRIHPDDRDNVQAVAEAAILRGEPIEHEYRIVHPDGEVRWISDRGRVLVDHLGRPSRVIGLNIDITQLKLAQQALLEGEEEYRLTFEHASVGVAHVSLDGVFTKLNPALASMLGYEREELTALTFQEITHPEDLGDDLAKLSRLLAGEITSYEMEKRYRRKDGSFLWAHLAVALKHDGAGEPHHFISVISDISARKSSEQQTEEMLSEMLHRANNMFAVVHSLIRQTRRSADDLDSFSESLADRISALAVSHQLLAGAVRKGASLEDLVVGQMAAFVRGATDRLHVEGPEVRLGEVATRSIGMALHELGTNACKYGALSNEVGQVHVTWTVSATDEPVMSLTWAEVGGPTVAPPARKGFGKRVTREMVTQRLGGEVDLSFPTTGAVWRFNCPLASLRD